MSSRSEASSSGPRVRPVTWAILAWMIIMIAAILGAWQGSESRYGAIPQITIATDRAQEKVLPYTATDLDGNTQTNPIAEFELSGQEHFTVRLPSELHNSEVSVHEIRANGTRDYEISPDSPGWFLVPTSTPDEGLIEGLVLQSGAVVYAADGSESLLSGEWSVGFTHTG